MTSIANLRTLQHKPLFAALFAAESGRLFVAGTAQCLDNVCLLVCVRLRISGRILTRRDRECQRQPPSQVSSYLTQTPPKDLVFGRLKRQLGFWLSVFWMNLHPWIWYLGSGGFRFEVVFCREYSPDD